MVWIDPLFEAYRSCSKAITEFHNFPSLRTTSTPKTCWTSDSGKDQFANVVFTHPRRTATFEDDGTRFLARLSMVLQTR